MKPWSEIPEGGRERDAAVSEFVMGWKNIDGLEPLRNHTANGGYIYEGVPKQIPYGILGVDWRPMTDARDDYQVLCRVRETWDHKTKWRFGSLLHKRMESRWRNPHPADENFMVAFYEPGDYSAAAYEALRASQ